MRRRFTDDADMRLYLSRFLQAVDETSWPRHSAKLLLYISAQPNGRVAYSKATLECDLNEGQMERAVSALTAEKLIVRADNHEDARRVDLQITRIGEDVIGKLDDRAQRKLKHL
jgi:DNA-binding MarR family transcriptional regulator